MDQGIFLIFCIVYLVQSGFEFYIIPLSILYMMKSPVSLGSGFFFYLNSYFLGQNCCFFRKTIVLLALSSVNILLSLDNPLIEQTIYQLLP